MHLRRSAHPDPRKRDKGNKVRGPDLCLKLGLHALLEETARCNR